MTRGFWSFGFKNNKFLHNYANNEVFGNQNRGGKQPHFGAYGTKNGKIDA
jgi:hypothetical protein